MSTNETEKLVRLSRSQLWFALLFVSVLGTMAVAALAFPEARARTHSAWTTFPIFIAVGVAALRRQAQRNKVDASSPRMQAVLDDELRAASLQKACRNALVGVMVLQPLAALAVTVAGVPNPAVLMSVATIFAGLALTLAFQLYYDR